MKKVLRPTVRVHHHLVSIDTLTAMDDGELEARIDHFMGQARDVLNTKIDSKNIELYAEMQGAAKQYVREALRTNMVLMTRRQVFNGKAPGQMKPADMLQSLAGATSVEAG